MRKIPACLNHPPESADQKDGIDDWRQVGDVIAELIRRLERKERAAA